MRCKWVTSDLVYIKYHDEEWGIPSYEDRYLFEMLILEGFQAGLSWLTILKKREDFKKSFDNFDVIKVSKYSKEKTDELFCNQKIVRNKRKILASINNAKIFIGIQKEFDSFSNYIWGFTNNEVIKNKDDVFLTNNALSDQISFDLKRRGMKFVGSTIIYAYLQAIGIIDDHELSCFRY